jgi:hypothetical protein
LAAYLKIEDLDGWVLSFPHSVEIRTTQIKAAAWTTQFAAMLLQFR